MLDLLDALNASDGVDVIRSAVQVMLQELIEAEATALIGAERHERTESRTVQRKGHRSRTLSTTAGDLELAIPKLRIGSFFPSLLERRRRIDQALFAVVTEAYVTGTSVRKVDDLVKALGADTGISKSEVSRICADLDADITALADFPVASLGKPCQPGSREVNLQRTSALGNDRRGLAHRLKVADMSYVPLIGALEYDEKPECVT